MTTDCRGCEPGVKLGRGLRTPSAGSRTQPQNWWVKEVGGGTAKQRSFRTGNTPHDAMADEPMDLSLNVCQEQPALWKMDLG